MEKSAPAYDSFRMPVELSPLQKITLNRRTMKLERTRSRLCHAANLPKTFPIQNLWDVPGLRTHTPYPLSGST